MMNNLMKSFLIIGGISLSLVASGCENNEKKVVTEEKKIERTEKTNSGPGTKTETTETRTYSE